MLVQLPQASAANSGGRVTPIGRPAPRAVVSDLPAQGAPSRNDADFAFHDAFATSIDSSWSPDTDGWICQAGDLGPATDAGGEIVLDASLPGPSVDGDGAGSATQGDWRTVDFGLNPPASAKVEIGAGVGVGLNFDAAGTFKSVGFSMKF
jgi:hypothetical protein